MIIRATLKKYSNGLQHTNNIRKIPYQLNEPTLHHLSLHILMPVKVKLHNKNKNMHPKKNKKDSRTYQFKVFLSP